MTSAVEISFQSYSEATLSVAVLSTETLSTTVVSALSESVEDSLAAVLPPQDANEMANTAIKLKINFLINTFLKKLFSYAKI